MTVTIACLAAMNRNDHSLCSIAPGSITINLHIQPRASRNAVSGLRENALRISLTSPPVDGEANRLCREFLAELFSVSKSSVTIISGETSRYKRVRITAEDTERIQKVIMDLVEQAAIIPEKNQNKVTKGHNHGTSKKRG